MLKRVLINAQFWVEGRQDPFEGCVLYEFKESGPGCYQRLSRFFPEYLLENTLERKIEDNSPFIKLYNNFPSRCSWVDCLLCAKELRFWRAEKGILYIPVKKICAFCIYDSISAVLAQKGDPQADIDAATAKEGLEPEDESIYDNCTYYTITN